MIWKLSMQTEPMAVKVASAHLMDEHGGVLGGGHNGGAWASVAAEGKAPAVARGQRQAKGVRAVHHREALQPLQSQLCLHCLHRRPGTATHLRHKCASQACGWLH